MELTDNIFKRKFHAKELYDWFEEHFPDSFGISIQKGSKPFEHSFDKEVWSTRSIFMRVARNKWYKRYPTEYSLYDQPNFHVQSGDENTYLSFLIESDEDCFIVHWGYKRYEVDGDYAAILASIIFDTCHRKLIGTDYCLVSLKKYYETKAASRI